MVKKIKLQARDVLVLEAGPSSKNAQNDTCSLQVVCDPCLREFPLRYTQTRRKNQPVTASQSLLIPNSARLGMLLAPDRLENRAYHRQM